MYTFMMLLIILLSIFMIFIVLVQNPKGGGLGAGFGGGASSAMGGVQQTNSFLNRTTWVLIVAIFFMAITANFFLPDRTNNVGSDGDTKIENIIENE